MKHLESKLQQSCVTWFRYQYHSISDLLFAIPSGGYRNITEAKIMMGEGVTPGIPDLMLAVPKGIYHALWVEMKSAKGKLSKSQKHMIALLKEQGYAVAVCYNFDEFKNTVEQYLSL